MRLTTLSDSILLREQHYADSRKILRESCDGLTLEQKRIVETIYREFVPLIEASLTVDQIKQIFGAVEKTSIEGGQSRTLAGKGVDVAKKANEVINKIGTWLQDTTPVKFADQKFEQLKGKVGAKFPELDKQLTGLGTWMKENPGKSAAIIGVLTALASLAGGPVGGAIAGQVLRGAAELIKGEKLSTAVGKGIKTAAYGAIAGWLLDGLGDWLAGLRAEVVPFDKVPGLVQLDVGVTRTLTGFGSELKQRVYSVFVPEDLAGTMQATINAARGGDVDAFKQIYDFSKNFSRSDYLAGMQISNAIAKSIAQENDLFLKGIEAANKIITAAAQGSIAGKMAAGDTVKVDGKPIVPEGGAPKESYYIQTKPLSEGQVYLVFNRVLTEAGFMDKIKSGASWLGKQATEKVTSAKLTAAWKLEGSPTDSEVLKKFLLDYGGITPEVVDKVYQDMKLPTEGGADIENLKIEAAKMTMDQLKQAMEKLKSEGKGKGDPAFDVYTTEIQNRGIENVKKLAPTLKPEELQSRLDFLTQQKRGLGDPIYDIYAAELEKRKSGEKSIDKMSVAELTEYLKGLGTKERQRLLAYLQKQLGIA